MRKFVASLSIVAFFGLGAIAWAEKEKADEKGEEGEKGKKAEVVCPISKKAINKDVFIEVNGEKTFFCCKQCPDKYVKDVLKVVDEGVEKAKCPLSGKEVKAETALIQRTAEKLSFCCFNCQKKCIETNKLVAKDDGPKTCPVSGKPAKAEHSLNVNGEKIYFCCNNCPKGYAKNLGVKETTGEAKCPLSGKPAKDETSLIKLSYKKVYFCCNNCRSKYAEKNFPAAKKDGETKEEAKKAG